jgi:hypothetical protein
LIGQIEVVEQRLADLYLALHCASFAMEGTFSYDPSGTAQSLADLLVHGTINEATLAYGLAPKESYTHDQTRWYWAKRAAALPVEPETRHNVRVLGEPHNPPLLPDGAPRRR